LPVNEIVWPVALIAGDPTRAQRFLPVARAALIDAGDDVLLLELDPDEVEPVDTIFAYPYGRFRKPPSFDRARRLGAASVAPLRQWWRVALAAEIAGAAQAAVAFTVDNVKQRHVFGKPIGAGVPGATYGFTQEVADMITACQSLEDCDTGGIGGTLAGNALSLAAMRATLTKVLTKEAFDRMIPMAERWAAGVAKAIADLGLPWHVTRLGCRAEYMFGPEPKTGTQAHNAMDFELERLMHLYAMNRGILLTPFHNMALMSPQADPEDVDQHTRVFREAVKELVA
jgi:hypothetical protein